MKRLELLLAGIAFALLASFGSFCFGRSAGARGERHKRYLAERQHIVDTLTIVKTQLRVDSVRVGESKVVMDTARARFAHSDIRIKIVGDSALSIDGLPPATMIPAISVIPDLENARATIRLDSIAYAALDTELVHERHRGDLEERRAILAEQELRDTKGSRFGVKTGVVIGVAVTYAVTHPKQVAKAIARVITLVQ